MKKLAIPALLAATIMVAGAFAFMPVEQASTVHNSAGGPTKIIVVESNLCSTTDATGTACNNVAFDMPAGTDAVLLSSKIVFTDAADGGNETLDSSVLTINGGASAVDPIAAQMTNTETEIVDLGTIGVEGEGDDTITATLTFANLDGTAGVPDETIQMSFVLEVTGPTTGIALALE